jgi:copper chaperone CopZ
MKLIIKTIFFGALLIAVNSVSAQKTEEVKTKKKKIETTEFTVSGVCKDCEKRIENAALIKGVKMVSWNKEEQKLKVIYNTQKTTIEDIHKAIAGAGHDTDLIKAQESIYKKLPACCQYRDGVGIH